MTEDENRQAFERTAAQVQTAITAVHERCVVEGGVCIVAIVIRADGPGVAVRTAEPRGAGPGNVPSRLRQVADAIEAMGGMPTEPPPPPDKERN